MISLFSAVYIGLILTVHMDVEQKRKSFPFLLKHALFNRQIYRIDDSH